MSFYFNYYYCSCECLLFPGTCNNFLGVLSGTMDNLMSDIFASATGKTAVKFPVSSFNIDSLILSDDLRHETSITSGEPLDTSGSTFTDVSTCYVSSDDSCHGDTSAEESDDNDISARYNVFNMAPSATPCYIPGDYYSLSPPQSPSIGFHHVSPHHHVQSQPRRLAFSIDSILGNTSDVSIERRLFNSANVINSTSSEVTDTTSSATSDVSFSLNDWDFFKRYRSNKSTSSTSRYVSRALYWCHVCEDTCSDAADADAHQFHHHSNSDTCKLQQGLLKDVGYVSVHSGTSHWNKVTCGICQKIVFKHFFSRHIHGHDGHMCHICSEEFPTRAKLHDHVNTHSTRKPHTCNSCSHTFSNRQQLSNHARRHKSSNHKCIYCDKSFRSKYACTVHERVHSGQKPYHCHVSGCSKAFTQKLQLSLHLLIHKKSHNYTTC